MDRRFYPPIFNEDQPVTVEDLKNAGLTLLLDYGDEQLWFKSPWWYRVKHRFVDEVYTCY